MTNIKSCKRTLIYLLLVVVPLLSCKYASKSGGNTNSNSSSSSSTDAGASGVEKVKPAPGTGNVQGKVLYNSKPAENIEVKLCEKFNQFFGGCSGRTYTAKTDKDGEYVLKNVEPKTYEALTAQVFDTNFYVFATTGIAGLTTKSYEVTADKTIFVTPTNLFKNDLKVLNPKAGEKVNAEKLELRWASYPDATYYKFSLYPEEATVTSPYINERVEGASFVLEKTLAKGTYRVEITAYNEKDVKLSESSSDIKFTVN